MRSSSRRTSPARSPVRSACAARPANAPSRARSASAGRSRYEELEHAEGRLAERQRDRDEVAGLLDGLAVTSQGGGGRLS